MPVKKAAAKKKKKKEEPKKVAAKPAPKKEAKPAPKKAEPKKAAPSANASYHLSKREDGKWQVKFAGILVLLAKGKRKRNLVLIPKEYK